MKRLAPLAVIALVAGCGNTTTRTVTVTRTQAPPVRPRQVVMFGHIRSLTREHGKLLLRFDPAWWLGGAVGERAAVADGVLKPGEPIPNDVYTVEEGHRLLTFDVSPRARVTLVGRELKPTRVSVDELAELLRGRNPRHRTLFGPGSVRGFGYWVTVSSKYPDAIVEIDQQYHP